MRASIREQFVRDFSEVAAQLLEAAAEEHNNDIHGNKGSDPFKWVIYICIGYQCFDKYQHDHGLDEFNVEKFKRWCKEKAGLDTHDGDVDYLALMVGVYNEYMPGDGE